MLVATPHSNQNLPLFRITISRALFSHRDVRRLAAPSERDWKRNAHAKIARARGVSRALHARTRACACACNNAAPGPRPGGRAHGHREKSAGERKRSSVMA